jgi:hypothetical protein
MNVYINQVDDGLGSADAWDEILGDTRNAVGGQLGEVDEEQASSPI